MRKASPRDVADEFAASTLVALNEWREIDSAVKGKSLKIRRRVASDAFFGLAVSWERFLSQWMVAAVNKDASQAVAFLGKKIESYAVAELRVPVTHISSSPIAKSHFSLALAREVLDERDGNLAIRSYKELEKTSRDWLADPFRSALLGVSKSEFAWILATRLIRNALAHQSNLAVGAANDALKSQSMPPEIRSGGSRRLSVDGWRGYIRKPTKPHSSSVATLGKRAQPRLALFHLRLAAVANKLKVP